MMETLKKSESLSRLDSYRSLVRYGYSTQEKLSRLNVLNDYYSSLRDGPREEVLCSNIECAESLQAGDDLVLPLPVRGVFLTEGKPKARFYPDEEIRKSVDNPVNKEFPLMLDHKRNEAGAIVGKVTEIWYDEELKAARWRGHVNDETTARNVMDGTASEVSVTVFAVNEFSQEYGRLGRNLTYAELSIVIDGSSEGNLIEPDLDRR